MPAREPSGGYLGRAHVCGLDMHAVLYGVDWRAVQCSGSAWSLPILMIQVIISYEKLAWASHVIKIRGVSAGSALCKPVDGPQLLSRALGWTHPKLCRGLAHALADKLHQANL